MDEEMVVLVVLGFCMEGGTYWVCDPGECHPIPGIAKRCNPPSPPGVMKWGDKIKSM